MNIESILDTNPFGLKKIKKSIFFDKNFKKIMNFHSSKSTLFKKLSTQLFTSYNKNSKLNAYPFIPIRLFKEHELKSIGTKDIYRILNSSGTSGSLSKIFLDKDNSKNQIKVLNRIASEFLGNERLPMLVVDKKNTNSLKTSFSAREAGISGFAMFGKDLTYALDEDMNIDYGKINIFLKKYKDKKFIIYGFTSIIWEYLVKKINKKKLSGYLSNALILHGGGWKKLAQENISNISFKKKIKEQLNIDNIINYYGMVEQTGSIFFECVHGFFHTSVFSEIIIRDINFSSVENNKEGMIQLLSLIPSSYPGNSILTEDLGIIIGEDNCKCGRLGKYFLVNGRIADAELRGCSDAY
jgi:phenylacetate-coenzyme A ligase PaaK-like adenylate-forming protein|tara:strand:+ start:1 stop:1062 length:1062 start_codon:yes stop_codon:yes gene_type:complete